MIDQVTVLHAGSTAAVCVLGLAAVVAFRQRLGRAAPLAGVAFVLLAAAQVAALLWIDRLDGRLAAATPAETIDIADLAAWVRGASGAVSAVAYVLLLAALVAGREKAPD